MSRFQKSIIILLVALLMTGCVPATITPEVAGPTQTNQRSEGEVKPVGLIQSDKPRIENPQVPDADLQTMECGNRAFALDLYQQLRGQDGNLFYSPYSISLALAMTYAGARGETESQMAQALHFDLPQASLHPAFNALSQALESRAKTNENNQQEGLTLNIANALWGQADFSFQNDFLDTLAENYSAGMRLVDFSQSEQARSQINDWVAKQTREKIQDLIPSGALTPLTRLVLTNAIYFKAAWQYQFEKSATSKEDFTLQNSDIVKVDMMQQSERLGYANDDGYQAVELPYTGGNASMVVLVPDQGRFSDFESSLSADKLVEILSALEDQQVDLAIPKFKVESSFGLNEALSALGMPDAFDVNKADFSGMTGQSNLYISKVLHKAFVNVDEEGTEAAASTAVIMDLKSMPTQVVTLRIDRPFIFLIRDVDSGTILFMGRVLDPR